MVFVNHIYRFWILKMFKIIMFNLICGNPTIVYASFRTVLKPTQKNKEFQIIMIIKF